MTVTKSENTCPLNYSGTYYIEYLYTDEAITYSEKA